LQYKQTNTKRKPLSDSPYRTLSPWPKRLYKLIKPYSHANVTRKLCRCSCLILTLQLMWITPECIHKHLDSVRIAVELALKHKTNIANNGHFYRKNNAILSFCIQYLNDIIVHWICICLCLHIFLLLCLPFLHVSNRRRAA